jgi:hypothetical protein
MRTEQHGFEDSFSHADLHASRIRIVPRDRAEDAEAELRLLFPHEPVHVAPMGCPHLCVYTVSAPASLVAERIDEHLEDVEHRQLRH